MERIPTIQLVLDLKRIGMKTYVGARARCLEMIAAAIESELQLRVQRALKEVMV